MKVIFMGTPSFGVPILRAIYTSTHEPISVVTQPDRPRGRGRKLGISPVKELAKGLGLPIIQPQTTKDEAFVDELKRMSPDLIAVAAYGRMLTGGLLSIPPFGCINVHASLLPKYRGAAPIQWALVNGERTTGVTIMKMDQGMDTGDILLAREVEIGDEDTAQSLHDKLAEAGANLIVTAMDGLERGTIHPMPQDHREATYAPPLRKEDGLIDWSQGAHEIFNRIRGFDPWPGAFTYLRGLRLKVFRGEVIEEECEERAGKVVQSGAEGLKIATGKGCLLIKEVQLEGRKRMPVREFLVGNEVPPGTHMR